MNRSNFFGVTFVQSRPAAGVDRARQHSRLLGRFLVLAACLSAPAHRALAADIYLAPHGDDANDGASAGRAVATLQHAADLAMQQPDYGQTPARILVQPGTYQGQSVVLDGRGPAGKLAIIGQTRDPLRLPVFIGNGGTQTWLKLNASNGAPTGLTIEALEIRSYFTAISLDGNRDDIRADNSGTTIRRNIFRAIGSIASDSGDTPSTAALRFVNSKNNVVESNQFHAIRNKKSCGGLHALYLAHFSSGNRIVNNVFDDACGSVIKLRDRSNDNLIENNRFTHLEKAPALEEWYCDMGARKDCTKKLGECPSTGNLQRDNALTQSGQAKLVSVIGNLERRSWCSNDDFARARVQAR